MDNQEWSRSRYWLCHFLHNRHERPAIAWPPPPEVSLEGSPKNPAEISPTPSRESAAEKSSRHAGLVRWLNRCAAGRYAPGPWLIDQALNHHRHDPAYVQSLRLLAKERHHHADLARRLLVCLGSRPPAPARPGPLMHFGRVVGLRFELAALLLTDFINITLLERAAAAPADADAGQSAPVRAVCLAILADQSAHVAFLSERLTMEFADFNFVRRNLRRARLRAIFAPKLALAAAQDRKLVAAAGVSRCGFSRICWRRFQAVLESMVPYHREALLRELLAQREKPFEKTRAALPEN